MVGKNSHSKMPLEKQTALKADQDVRAPGTIRGTLLAWNTVLNLAGQVLPLLVALPAVPYIIHRLGVDRFGVLSLAWAVLNMSTILDLGLGRATTKFVAEYMGQGKEGQVPSVVWSSLVAQMPLGLVGGILVALFTPVVAGRWLRVPAPLVGETETVFYIIAASLPLVLASNPLRGALEAMQRFDLVNYVRVPTTALMFLLPAGAAAWGVRLPGIVLLLTLVRAAMTLAYLILCFRTLPILRRRFSFKGSGIRQLLAYGGWVMVSNLTAPFFLSLDRFMIGALLSVAAVSYYTPPWEIARRTVAFPFSLSSTLFPFFGWHGQKDRDLLCRVSAKACKFILLAMCPVTIVLMVFAGDILRLWLGADFAKQGAVVLQTLGLSFLLNGLTYVPYTAIQGLGRPDWKAKLDVFNLFLLGLLFWWLIPGLGINGAAFSTLAVTSFDCVAEFWLSRKLGVFPLWSPSARSLWRTMLLSGGLAVAVVTVKSLRLPLGSTALAILALFSAFVYVFWKVGMEGDERAVLRDWTARLSEVGRPSRALAPGEPSAAEVSLHRGKSV